METLEEESSCAVVCYEILVRTFFNTIFNDNIMWSRYFQLTIAFRLFKLCPRSHALFESRHHI